MAHTQMVNHESSSRLSGIGQKIKEGAEIAGALKSIFDISKAIYQGVQTAAPYAAAGAALLI